MTTWSRAEAAAAFGVSVRTLSSWMHHEDPPLPVVRKGTRGVQAQIDSAAAIDWYGRRMRREASGRAGGAERALSLEEERCRLTAAQADKVELEVARLRLEQIPADVVERVVAGMVQAFRSRILGIAPSLAPVVAAEDDPRACQELMATAHDDALRELHEFDPTDYATGDVDVAAAAATRDPDSQATPQADC